jgi:elongation factor Ts
MSNITAADISKLRKITGAGMMDCKKALTEAEGDFERAKDLIRERGLAIANKRADRDATEGAVLAMVSEDKKHGVVVGVNCETDFVAKNADFVGMVQEILVLALEKQPANIDALKALELNGQKIEELVAERSGITGEKMELSYYEFINADYVISYIHMGNKLATIVGFNKTTEESIAKDIAMQVAAMNPVSVDTESVPKEVIDRELAIGREQAKNDGKPENMLDKIAQGKLNKFFKESILLNQEFVKEGKISVSDYLKKHDAELSVTEFKRFGLSN